MPNLINTLKTPLIVAMSVFTLSSCTLAPSFTPNTIEGANCKKECAHKQQSCRASSYTCDQGYASCLEVCLDIERISSGK